MRFHPFYKLLILVAVVTGCKMAGNNSNFEIMTVNGPVQVGKMGLTLEHEHAIVDFTGAEKVYQPQYPIRLAMDTLLPYFDQVKGFGVQTFIECTPNYIGRDVVLLKEISKATGLNIITNTGYYAAADKKYIPKHAYHHTAMQLAEKWIEEWVNGIDATGIKPGFIKLGVGKGPLDELERKIVKAGAIAHLATGLKIAIHTGGVNAALDEIAILETQGVDPQALIVVHAQNLSEEEQISIAKKGAWVSLDGVQESTGSVYKYSQYLIHLKNNHLLDQALISQDAYWQVVKNENEEIGLTHHGSPYSAIFKGLIPALKNAGFTQEDIDLLLVKNPARAYRIEVLKL